MSTYYVDAVGGNDSNNGTSFALRKKTITSLGATPVAGDEVRVMGVGAPTLVGNATFTNESSTVTLASAATLNIETCETAWTAAANVTATATSVSGEYKEGTAAAKLVIATAFTTGRVAHKQIGGGSPVDFSGYQQISFWMRSTVAISSGVFEIRLCSDTGGTTAVNTLSVTVTASGAVWKAMTLNNGANLSNNVQSVALYCASDPGAVTVNLDNILAVKAASSADSLSLTSLIGKNTGGVETFYPLQSINGTTVIIGGSVGLTSGSTNLRGYYGTTETVSLYKLQPQTQTTNSSTTVSSFGAIGFSGAAGNPVLVSGGWNTTDMSTQDGESWIAQVSTNNIGVAAADKSWITFSKLNFIQFYTGYLFTGNCSNIVLTNPQCHGNFGWGISAGGFCGNFTITTPKTYLNGNYGLTPGNNSLVTSPISYGNAATGIFFAGGNNNNITLASVINNSVGIDFYSTCNNRMYTATTGDSYGASALTISSGTGYMFNCTVPEAVEFLPGTTFTDGKIFSHNHDNTADNHRIFTDGGLIASDSAQREKSSGIAWRMDVTSANRSATYPLKLGEVSRPDSIKIACVANKLVTVSARVMRNNTGITLIMLLPGGQIAGVPSDVTATASASASTYETITLTFTPTAAGVVDVFMLAYGGTTFSAYIDKMATIIQEA